MVLVDKRNEEGARKAIEYLEQAVALDPNYSIAYARLANAHSTLVYAGVTDDNGDEEFLKARAAIDRALAIDDSLAEAHSYLGEIYHYQGDFVGAEREDKLAVELNPNSSAAHREYAWVLSDLGRTDEALAQITSALDLEPASAVNHQLHGFLLFFARQYDAAILESKRALEIDPQYFFAYNVLQNSYHAKGEDDHAFEAFLKMRTLGFDETDKIDTWKTIYARSGWPGILERERKNYKAAVETKNKSRGKLAFFYNQLGVISIELGQFDQALTYLEKAAGQDPSLIQMFKVNPRYDPLRSDPRFDDLLRKASSD
jgi:tetratricopeptide (TPR) repeat protein